jgi:hypothetical protein
LIGYDHGRYTIQEYVANIRECPGFNSMYRRAMQDVT